MRKITLKHSLFFVWIITLIFGFVYNFSTYLYDLRKHSLKVQVLFIALLILFSGVLFSFLIIKFNQWIKLSHKQKLYIALLLALLASTIIFLNFSKTLLVIPPENHALEISSIPIDGQTSSFKIHLLEIRDFNNQIITFDRLEKTGDWKEQDGTLVSNPLESSSLKYCFIGGEKQHIQILFRSHAQSGAAKVRIDSNSEIFELYHEDTGDVLVNLHIDHKRQSGILLFIIQFVFIGTILLFILIPILNMLLPVINMTNLIRMQFLMITIILIMGIFLNLYTFKNNIAIREYYEQKHSNITSNSLSALGGPPTFSKFGFCYFLNDNLDGATVFVYPDLYTEYKSLIHMDLFDIPYFELCAIQSNFKSMIYEVELSESESKRLLKLEHINFYTNTFGKKQVVILEHFDSAESFIIKLYDNNLYLIPFILTPEYNYP